MIPEGRVDGQGWRGALAALAFAVTAAAIYGLFASGFGRVRAGAGETGAGEAGAGETSAPAARPQAGAVAVPKPAVPGLAVIADDFWLTYLPPGLRRSGSGPIGAGPGGGTGGWARYGTPAAYVEARVERGPVAADWPRYRAHVPLLDARGTVLRGRPAVVGRDPRGGRAVAWLERPGTGAWVRVSESLGKELLAVAASAHAPVGD
ncbi:hypothetical protein MF672_014865 [Actinomadura sp. ATCC 31491]|uniref:Secreted protein n=1 Tax=Actinomadura luzonensis TaxID=2805427 RepID=A0ABT0FRU6_9ACTN|nr:hypothetical protein [Actinomadura luzonensis]MCK2215059.1 hypothetical protein [Actinomadura luzonensis]